MSDFDYETALSIETIRQHTKTDDDVSVDDDLIRIYRRAAFVTSEYYTGVPVTPIRSVSEPVKLRATRRSRTVRLSRYLAGYSVTFYGGGMAGPVTVRSHPGAKEINFPGCGTDRVYTVGSCYSCGESSDQLMATYETGIASLKDVNPLIIMGVLKYIAWQIKNPGDQIMTTRNTLGTGESGITGTNDAALISGAADEWKRLARQVW